MRKAHSYNWLLWHFQDMLNVSDPNFLPDSEIRRKYLANKYRRYYGLSNYKLADIWLIIEKKFDKWFDELLYDDINDTIHGIKEKVKI